MTSNKHKHILFWKSFVYDELEGINSMKWMYDEIFEWIYVLMAGVLDFRVQI